MTVITWPESRSVSYDPDKVYDETTDTWSSSPLVLVKTAARYKNFIIACSRGEVYYGEV